MNKLLLSLFLATGVLIGDCSAMNRCRAGNWPFRLETSGYCPAKTKAQLEAEAKETAKFQREFRAAMEVDKKRVEAAVLERHKQRANESVVRRFKAELDEMARLSLQRIVESVQQLNIGSCDDCFEDCESIKVFNARQAAVEYYELLHRVVIVAINDEKGKKDDLGFSPVVRRYWMALCKRLDRKIKEKRAAEFEVAMAAQIQEMLFELIVENDGELKVSDIASDMPAGVIRDFMIAIEIFELLLPKAAPTLASHGQPASPSRA